MKGVLSDYKQNGFCTYRGLISQAKTLEVRDYILSLAVRLRSQSAQKGSHINYTDASEKHVNSIHRLEELEDQYLLGLVEDLKLSKLASSLLECNGVKLFSMQAFLKPAGVGLPTPPHQDNAYWCHSGNGGLTIWLALDPAGSHNSMMKYTTYSNDAILPHTLSKSTPGSSQLISWDLLLDCVWHQPELSQGDAAIHHGLVVHYSEANRSAHPRRGLLFNFRPENSVRDQERFKSYTARLESIYSRN